MGRVKEWKSEVIEKKIYRKKGKNSKCQKREKRVTKKSRE